MKTIRTLSAALLAAALLAQAPSALAGAVSPGAATAVQREQAQAKFIRGKELFTKKDYAGALVEFRASLDIVASPNTRLFAGRALRELGKLVEAYVELGRASVEAKEYAREDPRYVQAGEAASDERNALAKRLGFIELSVANVGESAALKVAGEEIRRAGWNEPLPVMPGTTEVVLETPGQAPVKRTVTLAAGERTKLALDAATPGSAPEPTPAPPPAPPSDSGDKNTSPLRYGAYAAAGVGALGFGTFALFGILANGTYGDLKDQCSSGPCPPGHEDQISKGKTQQTIANVGLVVGIAGAAAGVTLFVLSSGGEKKTGAAALVTTPGGAGIRGTF